MTPRAWEVSRGGEATGTWKLFEVGKASGARLLPGTFEPAPGYTPRDRAIPAPTVEVAPDGATENGKRRTVNGNALAGDGAGF